MADGGARRAQQQVIEPHNYEAEQALLGALFCNNAVFARVSAFLKPEHFADPLHSRIYEAAGKLIGRGMRADPVTLKNQFDQDGALAEIGGAQYLVQLAASVVTVIDAEDYAVAIRDLYTRRKLIALVETVARDAATYDPDHGGADIVAGLAARLAELDAVGVRSAPVRSMAEVMDAVLERAEAAFKGGDQVRGIATGLTDLDRILNGLCGADMMVLAGRPGMGKTACALSLARNMAGAGRRVGVESIEMSDEQLGLRVLAGPSGVNTTKVRRGAVTEADMQALIAAAADLRGLPIDIVGSASPTMDEIAARWRSHKQRRGLDVLIVDYLQLIRVPDKRNGRYEEVTAVSNGLKALAKQLDIPVIALAQLSREVEKRDNKRPVMSDLRESGAIEQDADQIVFLYRHEYYLEKEEPQRRAGEDQTKFDKRVQDWRDAMEACAGVAELIVAKNRHGGDGQCKARFDREKQRFETLARDGDSPDGPPATDPGDQWWNGGR